MFPNNRVNEKITAGYLLGHEMISTDFERFVDCHYSPAYINLLFILKFCITVLNFRFGK